MITQTLLLDPDTGLSHDVSSASLASESAAELEQVMQRDRDFFLQHPECDYYVRPITPVEIREGQALGKDVDESACVLVGEVVPGNRIRLTCIDGLPPPVEEFRASQQRLRKELGEKTATLKDRLKYNQKARPKAKGFGAKR